MKTLIIQIGNSDNKLTQYLWSEYISAVQKLLVFYDTQMHFNGFSNPDSQYQTATWVIDYPSKIIIEKLYLEFINIRKYYNQDSMAITVGFTEFI